MGQFPYPFQSRMPGIPESLVTALGANFREALMAKDVTATSVKSSASGSVSATTVQGAINELATEKVQAPTVVGDGQGVVWDQATTSWISRSLAKQKDLDALREEYDAHNHDSRYGGIKVGSFTPTAGGVLKITGVGFTPRMVTLTSGFNGLLTSDAIIGHGMCDKDLAQRLHILCVDAVGRAMWNSTGYAFGLLNNAGSFYYYGSIISFDGDGFTVNVNGAHASALVGFTATQ